MDLMVVIGVGNQRGSVFGRSFPLSRKLGIFSVHSPELLVDGMAVVWSCFVLTLWIDIPKSLTIRMVCNREARPVLEFRQRMDLPVGSHLNCVVAIDLTALILTAAHPTR